MDLMGYARQSAESASRIRDFDSVSRIEETRQEYATARTQFYQQAVVADGGDKARQFLMLVNTFREFGQLYDRGYRLRDSQAGAA